VAFDVPWRLATEESLQRARLRVALDCAAENVRYRKVRTRPCSTPRGLKPTAIVDAVLDAAGAQAPRRIRSHSSSAHRHMDPATSCGWPSWRWPTRARAWSFDWPGEEGTRPAPREALQLILDNNVNLTIHAGRLRPQSIAQAVHVCGPPHRHGPAARNGDLLNYRQRHRIPLEMLPLLQRPDRLGDRPLRPPAQVLLDFGLRGDRQHPTTGSSPADTKCSTAS